MVLEGIKTGLGDAAFSDVTISVKNSFLKCIEGFKDNSIKLRLIIHDLSMIVHKKGSSDAFFGHELQLHKPNNQQPIDLTR